jgi:hypothetical protein
MSGNTAWFNSVRAQLYLKPATTADGDKPDTELRELESKKSNYGPLANPTLLRWKVGVFVVEPGEGSLQRMAANSKVDELFLKLLGRFNEQDRSVSINVSRSYAPTMFAAQDEAKGTAKRALASAMQRLLDAGIIRNEAFGPPSRRRSRLVIV